MKRPDLVYGNRRIAFMGWLPSQGPGSRSRIYPFTIKLEDQPMYFIALAIDYDGTIAEDGVVAEATRAALRELKQSGRKLLLVTSRQLPDLKSVLIDIALFDLVVAENGGPSIRSEDRRGDAACTRTIAGFP